MDPTPAPGSEALRLAPTIQPMEFGTAGHDKIHEPVVEPVWSGVRVIVAAAGDESLLLDKATPIEGQERLRWHLTHQVAIAAVLLVRRA